MKKCSYNTHLGKYYYTNGSVTNSPRRPTIKNIELNCLVSVIDEFLDGFIPQPHRTWVVKLQVIGSTSCRPDDVTKGGM